ncbi:MAG: hypothetical protein KTR31_08635 [Myxococcales bacterium]|nr:hypothetical protein [Myxococcales bacterium]
MLTPRAATAATMFLLAFALVLFELVLTRLFGVVLFASLAHLALALALLGISVGALLQHLWPSLVPDEGLEERLGWIALAMAAATVLAVLFTVTVPITVQFEEPPEHYGERSSVSLSLVSPVWFSVLMPVLATPFVLAGLAFAGAFQRRKHDIGLLYGADLVGGAAAAVAFVPLLYVLPGPDVAFVVALAGCLAAMGSFWAVGKRSLAVACGLPAVLAVALTLVASTGTEVLQIRYAAGYSEDNVTYTRWTPLTRLAVHQGKRGDFMVLDNTSASEIVQTDKRRRILGLEANRGLVYRFVEPPARVAVLAASAGPEVAVAQSQGFTDIDAIDIAPEIGDVVATQYADVAVNPYTQPGTRRVVMDGRAAILHSEAPYDIIHMVHANLHSSAGQLANAWSPALLETKEAFVTYLSRLTDDGVLSFGRGSRTRWIVNAALAALTDMGVENPERHIVWVGGSAQVMLVKKQPWTEAEVAKLDREVKRRKGQYLEYDPIHPDPEKLARATRLPVLTDDTPYLDSPSKAVASLGDAFARFVTGDTEDVAPVQVVYTSLALQVTFVLLAGVLILALPRWRRTPTGLDGLQGVGWGLAYVSCLGYGYLAVETVLLHELVLFVGHPTYAITVVILAMLLFSGIGSMVVGRMRAEDLSRTLTRVLVVIVVLGALQAWVVPSVLYALAFGLPIAVRVGLVLCVLAPLGFVMGMPFPLALRILRPEAAGLVPWAWALNGWMSVVASLGTVLLSRMAGYNAAFGVALLAYVLAVPLSRRLASIASEPASVN